VSDAARSSLTAKKIMDPAILDFFTRTIYETNQTKGCWRTDAALFQGWLAQFATSCGATQDFIKRNGLMKTSSLAPAAAVGL
jgi:hypothetical protein